MTTDRAGPSYAAEPGRSAHEPPRREPPSGTGEVAPGVLPPEVLARLQYREAVEMARDRVSRDYLALLLREHDGNVTRAAHQAGLERESLHRLLRRYGFRSEDFRKR